MLEERGRPSVSSTAACEPGDGPQLVAFTFLINNNGSAKQKYLARAELNISDTLIWDRALSSAEISDVFAQTLIPEPSSYLSISMGLLGLAESC